jgi:hypothetical protein
MHRAGGARTSVRISEAADTMSGRRRNSPALARKPSSIALRTSSVMGKSLEQNVKVSDTPMRIDTRGFINASAIHIGRALIGCF